jgi:hypothetical protein
LGCAKRDPITGECLEGESFTKFGTQQLKFIDPAKPALGVKQLNVGQTFKGFTTGLVREITGLQHPFGAPTVFSQRIIAGITGATPVGASYVPPPATPNGGNGTGCECEACKTGTGVCSDKRAECNAWDIGCELFGLPNGNGNGEPTPTCTTCDSDKCKECNAWDVGCELSHMASGTCTPPVTPPTPTCECEACKNGTGECSDKKPCCNAWDILCEMGGECSKPKPPEECAFFDIGCKGGKWWDKYGLWVMLIGGLIGLGILLWLLRPLFGIAKNITGN